jgi:tetratricopeptide (TPR) repeat protein
MSTISTGSPPGSRSESNATVRNSHQGWRSLLWSIALAIGVIGVFLLMAIQHRLHSAEVALSAGAFRSAWDSAKSELKVDPNSSQALLIAGYAAQGMKQPAMAAGYFARVSDDGGANAVRAMVSLAQSTLQLGRASDSERLLRRALELDANHFEAQNQLIFLLVLEGRIWEAQQSIHKLLRSGRVDANHLFVTGSNRIKLGDSDGFAQACLAVAPADPLPRLPAARQAYRNHEVQQARTLAEQITTTRPEILEAQALLGTILAESDHAAFVAWTKNLPADAAAHPGIWFAQGLAAAKAGQNQAAARCFAECLQLQPNHVAANLQISRVLATLGQTSLAIEFGNRAQDLSDLESLINEVQGKWNYEKVAQVVRKLESLGRIWEAVAWCYVAELHGGKDTWIRSFQTRWSPRIDRVHAFLIDSANLVIHSDLLQYPLPVWGLEPTQSRARDLAASSSDTSSPSPTSSVAFRDDAERVGLRFTYQNGATSDNRESMFEFDGGGLAALDYDRDGWPDVYLTQGGILPSQNPDQGNSDRLFRNIGGRQFVDETVGARLGDTGYSQGVTFGDIDGDGFADIYVANIGPNTFYRNNGDGTFTEISISTNTAGSDWTSSSVLVDLNADSLPDLYVVNYLAGEELRTRPCLRNAPQRCHPREYPAAQDRLYVNLGNGQFEDVTARAGIEDRNGRGLGIVAADFDGTHRISLFVGNDMTPNYLFVNQTSVPGAMPAFAEMALLRGVAVDSRGYPKAAMGIAASDANGDGLLDLFVTNFYRESNDLYLQLPDHSFRDATQEANLTEASFYKLGWGAQFVDGELDGFADLILTNGHVHHPSDPSVPYRMPPQYFRNLGNGQFQELSEKGLGEFFAKPALGRSLARLDWNRDGLEDVCVSHLDTPVALLSNRTTGHGHFVALQLVGVESNRDAIGATVEIVASGRKLTRQLTAGDGYQAANERQLIVGIGIATSIESVVVHWPAGTTQEFTQLRPDRTWVLIEGQSDGKDISP